MPEYGNNFGMPQVQLPIFPAGVTHINSEVAFEERDGKVYYFNGHLPVFVHEKSALATFRLFSTQLVINGNATQAEISRAFGVPLVTDLSSKTRTGSAQFLLFLRKCKGLITLSRFLLFVRGVVGSHSITIRCAQGRNPAYSAKKIQKERKR